MDSSLHWAPCKSPEAGRGRAGGWPAPAAFQESPTGPHKTGFHWASAVGLLHTLLCCTHFVLSTLQGTAARFSDLNTCLTRPCPTARTGTWLNNWGTALGLSYAVLTEIGLKQMYGWNENEETKINQTDTDKMHSMKGCPTALKKWTTSKALDKNFR